MSDTPPQPEEMPAEPPTSGTVHHVVFSVSDTPEHAEPHPLEGKPAPTTGTLAFGQDQTLANGKTVDIVATFDEFMGDVELSFQVTQAVTGPDEPHLMREGSYHWSGHDSPHTTRIELVGWFPVVPADCTLELYVLGDEAQRSTKLAEMSFVVPPSG